MNNIVLRFVMSTTETSKLIRAQATGVSMPFVPSHVEALSRDGQHWTGAHIDGGVLARPLDYDTDPGLTVKTVKIQVEDKDYAAFHNFLEKHIGAPYDWEAILGFVPGVRMHTPGSMICSALMVLCLRADDCVFKWPVTKPAHQITPDMLFLILSTHVEISHEADYGYRPDADGQGQAQGMA